MKSTLKILALVVLALVTTLLGLSPGGAAALPVDRDPSRSLPSPVQKRDPTAAERFFYDQRAAPAKTIQPGALLRARRQVEERLPNAVIPAIPRENPGSGSTPRRASLPCRRSANRDGV